MGGDVDRVEEDILELGVAIAAQDPERIFDVARIDRVAPLQDIVELAQDLAGEGLVGLGALDAQRCAGYTDPDGERLLKRADVGVMLAEQLGEQARIVEMEFERVFDG